MLQSDGGGGAGDGGASRLASLEEENAQLRGAVERAEALFVQIEHANAKRELDLLSRWMSAESATKFVCAVPGNVFGPGGDFSQANGPVAHSLIRKCAEANAAGAPTFDCLGTGNPLRQFIFSEDI